MRGGLDRQALQAAMPAGAARNALDCALLDLEAKTSGQRVWNLLGRPAPRACTTAYTISLGTPEAMAAATAKAAHRPLLKIKLGGDGDGARIAAVRKAAPESELIVDANEAWTPDNLEQNLAACAEAGVTLVEQPLPAGQDEALARIRRPLAVCADESVHDRASLAGLRERYDAVNIKLDKTGGLTEALAMADAAQALGFEIMIGCMVATSLAMAPAMLLAAAGPLRRSRRSACCWRATATAGCATTAAWSIRRTRRSGADPPAGAAPATSRRRPTAPSRPSRNRRPARSGRRSRRTGSTRCW